jgi:hypothetical protein
MVQPPVALMLALLAQLTACAQEATGPQAAAATSHVVPVVVPSTWCPSRPPGSTDTAATRTAPAVERADCELRGGRRRAHGIHVDSTVAAGTTK